MNTLDFEGSIRLDEFGNLPVFYYSQEIPGYFDVSDPVLNPIAIAPFPSSSIAGEEKKSIGDGWKIFPRVSRGGEKWYLTIYFLPIRKSGGQSFERLTEFDLDIQLEQGSPSQNRELSFASTSVLSEGEWYKMSIARDGIYKIDRDFMVGLGIDIDNVNPQQINIYGNGGTLLPELNSAARYDDLQKCAIYINGEQDTSFDNQDYILFYGKGPDKWESFYDSTLDVTDMRQTRNYYSDSAYYFIRIDDTVPSRIGMLPNSSATATHTISKFQDYQYIENDLYNLAKSGREFYGDEYFLNTTGSYTFSFPNIVGEPAVLRAKIAARSLVNTSTMTMTAGGQQLALTPAATGDGATSSYAVEASGAISFTPTTPNINVEINFDPGNSEAKIWIDYITVNAQRSLTMAGSQLHFRDTTTVGAGNTGLFQLGNAQNIFMIWDITDYLNPSQVTNVLNGTTQEWKLSTDILHQFIAFNNNGYLVPTAVGSVENQNLHALSDIDLVIITAPIHSEAAQQLAELHAAQGMTVVLTNPVQVFNEFSSGNPDVIAFRMLMKMLFDRAQGNPELMPANLLLFGDGDYAATKGIENQLGKNVLVYETNNSLSPTGSSCSDDYFVTLDDNETGTNADKLDCGVGRIPASDRSEGLAYVDKVRTYISANTTVDGSASCLGDEVASPYGPWRNQIVFVADDQDGNGNPNEPGHLGIADQMADSIYIKHPQYDVLKIYLDAYTQQSTPGGERYPEAEDAIRNRVQNGALLVMYAGHGGERGWAHERCLNLSTIANWSNKTRLPVFLTATCELARFDDPEFNTAGEILVMNPNGGAIAMFTTTRIVYTGANDELNKGFFQVAFDDDNIQDLSLGQLNMLMKNDAVADSFNSSKPNFSLLGDPALRMAYPKYEVYTTHINSIPVENFADTLKALQEVRIQGYIGDADGAKLNQFNGFVYPTVFDKKTRVYTQNNDGGAVQQYDIFNKNIFKGKASVNGGDFDFRFVVPYDINYTADSGRVSYYAVAGNDDAHGFYQDFNIGSSLSNAQLNTVGPIIELFMNDSTFVSGGITDTSPILIAKLSDENGINTVGNGIGHDITAIVDNDTQNPLILNEYYETDLDTYRSGEVRYQMTDLIEGEHNMVLKAWDVHNNSNTASLNFLVAENSSIALQHVLNYPNPFTTSTEFMFEHNQACAMLDVRIQIFTVSGKLVKSIEQQVHQNGFRVDGIKWDGRDDFGDLIGKGVYVYKVELRNETGEKAEQFEKLVILK
ncbi:MAG: type IX secretion system sortase PorU [Flavobacteriales bacterium]